MDKLILLIDDSQMNLDVLSRRLQRAGYQTIAAMTGQEGISSAREFHPDLIILDFTLPDTSGDDIAIELKQDENTQGIPIIALSGIDAFEGKERAKNCGCSDYEEKPILFERLIHKIATLTGTQTP